MTPYEQSLSNLLLTLAFAAIVLVIRALLLQSIQKSRFPSNESRRRWIVQTRNVTILVLLLGVILIWAKELKEFAVSIVAIAVALVIATKEVLLCVLGGFSSIAQTSLQSETGWRLEPSAGT